MHQELLTLTRREAADTLRISLRTLDYLIASGTVRAHRIGRRVLILQSEIVKLLHHDTPVLQRRAAK